LTSGKTNNQLAKIAGYFFPVILTILFLYFAFKGIDLQKSFSLIAQSSILAIFLYVVVFFASHLARALRWRYMISSVKKDVTIFHLFGSVMVGYGVNCVIPRLGELYRGLFLGRWENISRTSVIGTIVVERVIDITTFALAALISVSIYSGDLYQEVNWLKTSLIIGYIFIFLITVFLFLLVRFQEQFKKIFLKLAAKINKKFESRLEGVFNTLISGLSSIKGTKNIIMLVVWSILILLFYALNSYVGFYIFGMESTGRVTFGMAWIVMTISSFSAMIPTPGGTGPYHLISIFVLTRLFQFGYEVSAAYALLTHFISYLLFVISTLIIIYIVNLSRQKKGLKKESFLSVFSIKSEEK
jgi:glycosyltransferase 2 family protein